MTPHPTALAVMSKDYFNSQDCICLSWYILTSHLGLQLDFVLSLLVAHSILPFCLGQAPFPSKVQSVFHKTPGSLCGSGLSLHRMPSPMAEEPLLLVSFMPYDGL